MLRRDGEEWEGVMGWERGEDGEEGCKANNTFFTIEWNTARPWPHPPVQACNRQTVQLCIQVLFPCQCTFSCEPGI